MKTKKISKSKVAEMIRKAIAYCKKKKIQISAGLWGVTMDRKKGYFVPTTSYNPSVCPLGALLVYKDGKIDFGAFRGPSEIAAYVLGVDEAWVYYFISGFDDSTERDFDETCRQAYMLGRKFRKELIK